MRPAACASAMYLRKPLLAARWRLSATATGSGLTQQAAAWISWSTSRNSHRAGAIGSLERHVTVQVRLRNMLDWSGRRRVEQLRIKARQNGPGSIEARPLEKNDHSLGKFLAKLVLLMEDIQRVGCATFAHG